MVNEKSSKLANLQNRLRAAVDEVGREEFVAGAGISTTTLQSFLQGAFPWDDQDSDASRRVRRAWARSATRIARLLDEDPFVLVQAIGLGADADTRDAIERELHQKPRDSSRPTPTNSRGSRDILEVIKWRAERAADHKPTAAGKKPVVRVGILDYKPFSIPLDDKSFFEEFADRLIGSIDPEWGISCEKTDTHGSIEYFVEELIDDDDPKYDMVLGLFETVHRRRLGIDFIPIPGWRISLDALCLWPLNRPDSERPRWHDVVSFRKNNPFVAALLKGEAGHLFLMGPCQYPESHTVLLKDMANERDLAEQIKKVAEQNGYERTVFIADEETCRRVMSWLNDGNRPNKCVIGDDKGFCAKQLIDAPQQCPKYSLALAFPEKGGGEWRKILQSAMDMELYGNASSITARLYAKLIARGWANDQMLDKATSVRTARGAKEDTAPRSTYSPEYFDLPRKSATDAFWIDIANHLAEELQNPRLAVTLGEGHDTPENAAIELASRLLPI